jgi:hypothetical protein
VSAVKLHLQQHAAAPHTAPSLSTVVMTVTNTGSVSSDFVGILFAVPPNPGSGGAPLKSVVGFDRVYVPAGATVTIDFDVSAFALAVVDGAGTHASVRGVWTLVVDDASATIAVQ